MWIIKVHHGPFNTDADVNVYYAAGEKTAIKIALYEILCILYNQFIDLYKPETIKSYLDFAEKDPWQFIHEWNDTTGYWIEIYPREKEEVISEKVASKRLGILTKEIKEALLIKDNKNEQGNS